MSGYKHGGWIQNRHLYNIEVRGNSITVYTTDGNSSYITISAEEEA